MKLVDAHHNLWIPDQFSPDLGYRRLHDIGAPDPFGDSTPIQRDYEWPDCPVDKLMKPYDNVVDALAHLLASIDDGDQRDICSGNARRLYRPTTALASA